MANLPIRSFLKGLLATVSAALAQCACVLGDYGAAGAQESTAVHMPLVHSGRSYTPIVGPSRTAPTATSFPASAVPPSTPTRLPATATPSAPTRTPAPFPTKPRVAHVHHGSVTSWDYSAGYYGDYVSQDCVDDMMASGVMALTGASSCPAAWEALLARVTPYEPGKRVAIKVNLNNTWDCNETNNALNALPQTVNAVISGLHAAGVELQDILVIDPSRHIPARLILACTSREQVHFVGNETVPCGGVQVSGETFASSDPSGVVTFSDSAIGFQRMADTLVAATYLINMPLLKGHSLTSVSLGHKNLLGCIPNPGALHDAIGEGGVARDPTQSPLVDLAANANVSGKAILTVNDSLFGNPESHSSGPSPWSTFAQHLGTASPNSLFLSTDMVAVDAVVCAVIAAERPAAVSDWVLNHLRLAEQRGLGCFEWGDPWYPAYSKLEFVRLTLD